MAQLAVFDIDGTLCDTNAIDDACFVRAVAEFLGTDPELIDWATAPHITDSGLLQWLCARHGRRPPDGAETEVVVNRFLDLLGDRAQSTPDDFRPVAGAYEALAALTELQWDVAVATGGWKRSAEFKLSRIRIDPGSIPLATADDASTRAEILRTAIRRAEARYGSRYTRIVSLGDAAWDVRTAAELGLPFIGVARAEDRDRLRRLGTTVILEDFTDLEALQIALDTALVPNVGGASATT